MRILRIQEMDEAVKAGTAVFVFGSNLAGVHGAGAARHALDHWGAVPGQGIGHHGMSYAIPTKSKTIRTMSLPAIWPYVVDFIRYAELHPDLTFKVTRIGCGLAGYRDADIAPMFNKAPIDNCLFDTNWHATLGDQFKYWGHVP